MSNLQRIDDADSPLHRDERGHPGTVPLHGVIDGDRDEEEISQSDEQRGAVDQQRIFTHVLDQEPDDDHQVGHRESEEVDVGRFGEAVLHKNYHVDQVGQNAGRRKGKSQNQVED